MMVNDLIKRNPLVAALINFFFWGGDYIYLGKRTTFGYGLLLVEILEHNPLLVLGLGIITKYPYYFYVIGHLLLCTLFAWDAYNMSLEVNPNFSIL
jgi:hypothetical protein